MFEVLSDRLDGIFKKVRSRGKLTEQDVDAVMREIRIALLEADVNVKVVRDFIGRVKERAVGAEVSKALDPGQQIVKIVHEELITTLGGEQAKLVMSSKPPTVIMLAGLQGSGKTTHAGKLAKHLKSQGLQPLLVGADLQRPAAVEQLRTLAERVGVPFYSAPSDPVSVARGAMEEASRLGRNVVIVDTAGRLQIDDALMDELKEIRNVVQPQNTLLVVDAMAGQEAVNVAVAFNETVPLDGLILTKIDGDARGGAALSVKQVVGKPILFVGTGEKLDEFEPFFPDRLAGRILGMGDVLSLIEKAEQTFSEQEAEKAAAMLQRGEFTLDDFLDQLQQVKKMGPLKNVIGMIPGLPKEVKNADIDDHELVKVQAIIQSMTREERANPKMINGSRRLRIAKGCGMQTQDVNQLLKQFSEMNKMMKQLGGMTRSKKGKMKMGGGLRQMRELANLQGGGGLEGLAGLGGPGAPGALGSGLPPSDFPGKN
ncbi:MAG: signal recognition particle protein [Acidimicrobiia bacterium]